MKKKALKDAPKWRGHTGRPTTYKYAYDEMLIEHMASGRSYYTFAAVVHTTRSTIDGWLQMYPNFREAYEVGHSKYVQFWEDTGIDGTRGKIKGFNPHSWSFNMKNRFRWADRVEHTGEQPIQLNKVLTIEEPKKVESIDLAGDLPEVRSGESEQEVSE